jgi:hypothetical protein
MKPGRRFQEIRRLETLKKPPPRRGGLETSRATVNIRHGQEWNVMTADAREFVDFWVQNSVHAAEPHGAEGASQRVSVLVEQCLEMAKSQGLTQADIEAVVGDLHAYLQTKLARANDTENARLDRH